MISVSLIILFLIIYVFPGIIISFCFTNLSFRNVFLVFLFSLLIVPVLSNLIAAIIPAGETLSAVFGLLYLFLSAAAVLVRLRKSDLRWPLKDFNFPGPEKIFVVVTGGIFLCLLCIGGIFQLIGDYEPTNDDEFKHIRVVTSIAVYGLPPQHPSFAEFSLSYYYYDHIMPGLLAFLSQGKIRPGTAWGIHRLIQTVVVLYFLAQISFYYIRESRAAFFLVWLTLLFGGGFDFYIQRLFLSSALADIPGLSFFHNEWWTLSWMKIKGGNLACQVSMPFTLFRWVPQHHFAGILVLFWTVLQRLSLPRWSMSFISAFLLSFIFGTSSFVFLVFVPTIIVTQLWDSARSEGGLRKNYLSIIPPFLITFIVFGILSFPMISLLNPFNKIQVLQPGLSLLDFNLISFLPPIVALPVILCCYYFLETGWVFIMAACTVLSCFYFRSFPVILRPLVFLFIFSLTFSIFSLGPRDYMMRSIIPSYLAMVILGGCFLQNLKPVLRKKLLLVCFCLLLVTFPSFVSEVFDAVSWEPRLERYYAIPRQEWTESLVIPDFEMAQTRQTQAEYLRLNWLEQNLYFLPAAKIYRTQAAQKFDYLYLKEKDFYSLPESGPVEPHLCTIYSRYSSQFSNLYFATPVKHDRPGLILVTERFRREFNLYRVTDQICSVGEERQ